MAKLNWTISRPGYGPQFDVEANTRADAIAIAESMWLADSAWEAEYVGKVDEDDGSVFKRSPIPDYVATKVGRAPKRPANRCPTHARHPGDIVGCGSANVTEPDHEGLCDCCDCGIWFRQNEPRLPSALRVQ